MKAVSQVHQSVRAATHWPIWQVRTTVIEWAALFALLLVVAVAALFARQNVSGYSLDLTVAQPPDSEIHLVGFHALERNNQFTYHWSSDYTFVQVPFGYNAAPRYIATVRLRAANPDGPQPLTFLSNEQPLATVTPGTEFRTYRMMLSHGTSDDRMLRFALQTGPFSPPGDPRDLGVILTSMTLQPAPHTNWAAVVLLPLALLALWGWLRWCAASARAALLLCSVLGAVLLVMYVLYRPAPLSYPLLALMAIGASAIAAPLAHETVSRLSLALLATLMSFSGVFWSSWMTDDAFISFRYAQNLVAGNGLVYNVGERVEGYTNFLWTMLAALVLAFGGDPVFWAYVAGVFLASALLLTTYAGARWLLGPVWALVAALFVATSQSVLIYTARGAGLETGLFALLVLVSSLFYLLWHAEQRRNDAILCGVCLALTSLTRPEGMLLMGLTVVHIFWIAFLDTRKPEDRTLTSFAPARLRVCVVHAIRRATFVVVPFLLIFVPYFVWRVSYYGDLLPNTFYAKTGGGLRQALRGLEYAQGFALAFGGPLLLAMLMPVMTDWRAALKRWHSYVLLVIGMYSAYIIIVGGDHFRGERFFVPLVPLFAIAMADGIGQIYQWCRQHTRLRSIVPVGLALGLIIFSGYALTRSERFDYIIRGDDESVGIWREIGWWMYDHTSTDESIAVTGAGAIAYYSERTSIDMLGLNDRHIARVEMENMGEGGAGHEKRDPDYVLHERQPAYIPRMWDDYFGGERVLRSQYTLIEIETRYGRTLELWKRNL